MTLEPEPGGPFHRSLGARLRSWFITGLVIFGPLGVTAYIAWWFVDTVDNWVRPLAPASLWPDSYLPFHIPGFGVVIVVIGLTLLGFFGANFAGRTLVGVGETVLARTPVLRGVYKSVKQIFETLFAHGGAHFRKVGLVEFPSKGAWSVVFISSDPVGAVADVLPERNMTSVFLPCTPNPTTGFYFYVPADEIIELPITPEDAAKLIMSAGLIQPEGRATLAALGEAARRKKSSLETGVASNS